MIVPMTKPRMIRGFSAYQSIIRINGSYAGLNSDLFASVLSRLQCLHAQSLIAH